MTFKGSSDKPHASVQIHKNVFVLYGNARILPAQDAYSLAEYLHFQSANLIHVALMAPLRFVTSSEFVPHKMLARGKCRILSKSTKKIYGDCAITQRTAASRDDFFSSSSYEHNIL